ncbi:MAG TPA: hypothetical protein VHP11_07205 [Tepidisphaeraceae bacterium]|nr:hypothetical protein [Tepidisphaeraceae bacterium]
MKAADNWQPSIDSFQEGELGWMAWVEAGPAMKRSEAKPRVVGRGFQISRLTSGKAVVLLNVMNRSFVGFAFWFNGYFYPAGETAS